MQTRERWVEHYHTMRDHSLWSIPYPIRVVVGLLIYRNINATLQGQGTGRYSGDEIRAFKTEIWDHIAGLLSESKAKVASQEEPFWALGHSQPTEADATLFGFLVSVLISNAGPESQEIVKSRPILVEYARRIHDAFFPDYERFA
jgi:hypothetical protein